MSAVGQVMDGGGGGGGCFVKGTMIEMSDGSEKEITYYRSVGEWTRGGHSSSKNGILIQTQSTITKGFSVTGSHLVMEDGQFDQKLEDSKHGIPTLTV